MVRSKGKVVKWSVGLDRQQEARKGQVGKWPEGLGKVGG